MPSYSRMADSKKPLRRLRKKQNQTLDKYSETIRSDLSKLDRLKFKAVIIIEIHARDVIEKMYKMSELIRVFFCNHSFILDTTLVLVTRICFIKIYSIYTRMYSQQITDHFIGPRPTQPHHVLALYCWRYDTLQ